MRIAGDSLTIEDAPQLAEGSFNMKPDPWTQCSSRGGLKMARIPITAKGRETDLCPNGKCRNYPLAAFIMFSVGLLLFSTAKVASATNGYIGLGTGPMVGAKCNNDYGCFNAPDIQNEGIIRLFGGYDFNENFSVEGAYMYLEHLSVGENVYGSNFQGKLTGFELTPVGSLTVAKDLSIFVRGGIVFWSSDMTYQIHAGPRTGSGSKNATGNDLVVSAGAKYYFSKHFGARAEYTVYYIEADKAGFGDFQFFMISGVIAF